MAITTSSNATTTAPAPVKPEPASTTSASPSTTASIAAATNSATVNTANATGQSKRRARHANNAERRATHNAVERMRRDNLNERFLTLVSMLPPLATLRRPSKAAIVHTSIATVDAARRHRVLAAQTLRALLREAENLRRFTSFLLSLYLFSTPPSDDVTPSAPCAFRVSAPRALRFAPLSLGGIVPLILVHARLAAVSLHVRPVVVVAAKSRPSLSHPPPRPSNFNVDAPVRSEAHAAVLRAEVEDFDVVLEDGLELEEEGEKEGEGEGMMTPARITAAARRTATRAAAAHRPRRRRWSTSHARAARHPTTAPFALASTRPPLLPLLALLRQLCLRLGRLGRPRDAARYAPCVLAPREHARAGAAVDQGGTGMGWAGNSPSHPAFHHQQHAAAQHAIRLREVYKQKQQRQMMGMGSGMGMRMGSGMGGRGMGGMQGQMGDLPLGVLQGQYLHQPTRYA
ncbi:hypothetical protein C8R47DRAFT_1078545 [Mycena vitilis]|nr:hypothetical protein C8R47DRAFT_1078545 [Mycena vitilis]